MSDTTNPATVETGSATTARTRAVTRRGFLGAAAAATATLLKTARSMAAGA